MFISLATWRDLTDGHLYHEGDQFPFDGRAVPEDRIEALENGRNRAGLRLIRADKASDEQPEGKKPEAPKKATGGRKTASAGKAKK
jgi:hypothetical protein